MTPGPRLRQTALCMSPLPLDTRPVEYPLARTARERYSFDAPSFADFALARELADKINLTRDLKNQPHLTVQAGQLAAAALLDEVFAHVLRLYVEQVEPSALEAAPGYLEHNLGETAVAEVFEAVEREFPTLAPLPGRPQMVERILRLWLANQNPSLELFRELFDEEPLLNTRYRLTMAALKAYFETLPPFGPDDQNLIELFLDVIRRYPDSLDAQLKHVLRSWGPLVEVFTSRILVHTDLISEENKPSFDGPGPSLVPDYQLEIHEYEAFTPDKAWMPEVVLLAKQTYVWLDQLSKQYERHIYRLDQVPDEELDEMARRGITGLWLIGVWQRSKASQKIKEMAGNPDAIASAYSLYSYDVAWEIGGQEALEDLRARAAQRGIRMASDMVPNHMAIDSQWLIEHPDWFIQLPYPPYGHANFDTPDLCDDERISVQIEAGYYSKTDASVVFKRTDNWTGESRYIYHGNDGTSYPWNDTAQLNYLLPEVREAVIQTILHVARQFPIIRFDAAMTLAKRHYHRLWYPAPGHGGDIPSRAGRGLTPDEFDAVMPQEFWREVVDRFAVEAPDTLLLAEAFWLMEGYFVRTLGMHRVYNSAFMVMMRDEENAKYRQVLKNTLEFDPDILGRFVNFVNNPDEKTAVEQFGKGDKYFGVCTLLATLPGLPMFGHGQIEGYAEKYGMEYPRAYWNEVPDAPFVEHHERVIFPLLHKRYLFASSENFTLYDFWNGEGFVNEDVFAYTNRSGNEKALVIFHNRYATVSGWLKTSVPIAQKDEGKNLATHELAYSMGLSNGESQWAIFRDNNTDLEYLRPCKELVEKGLYVELKEYGCHVFLNWREVHDQHGHYARLAQHLKGKGVPDVEVAVKEMVLEPLLTPLRELCDPVMWKGLWEARNARSKTAKAEFARSWKEWEEKSAGFAQAARHFLGTEVELSPIKEQTNARLEKVLALPKPLKGVAGAALDRKLADPEAHLPLLLWAALQDLGELLSKEDTRDLGTRSRAAFDDWLMDLLLQPVFHGFGLDDEGARRATATLRLLIAYAPAQPKDTFQFLNTMLADPEVQHLMKINRFEGVIWFNQEGFQEVLGWLRIAQLISGNTLPLDELETAAAESEFKLVKLMELVRKPKVPATSTNGMTPTTKSARKTAKTKTVPATVEIAK